MTLEEHVAAGPLWIQWWIMWMTIINLAVVLFVVRWSDGRIRFGHIEAYAIIAAIVAIAIFMHWLFHEFGYVRLLGLGHIPFWTPLAIFIIARLDLHPIRSVFGIYLRIFLATIVVSLVFDYTDVARWLMGERAPM